jgi:aminopeptidase N
VLFEALGVLGADPDARTRARALLADGGTADPALIAASVNIVAAHGTASDFDDFVARMAGAATPQEEQRYLGALADFSDPDLMRRLLAMSITDEVRTQNAALLLRRALTNRDNGELAWAFVTDEWATLNERLPSNSIVRMLEGVRLLSAPTVAPQVFAFFEDHEVPQGDKSLAQHLERLEVNVALRAREGETLDGELRH